MPDDFVRNDEILYRRISARRKLYKIRLDGTIEISSEAFSDRQLRVSVDRAKLCDNNPRYTLGNEPGIVVGLLTSDVRNVDDLTRNDPKGNPLFQFKIDVEPVPLSDNLRMQRYLLFQHLKMLTKEELFTGCVDVLSGLQRQSNRYFYSMTNR